MKNIISFASLFACLFVLVFACREKNDPPPSVYENCCGTVPTVDLVPLDTSAWSTDSIKPQYANVYVPNILVADNDNKGFSNIFTIFLGEGVSWVNLARITADNGEVYFEKKNFFPDGFSSSSGWDGTKPDGSIHTGMFNYEYQVRFYDGHVKIYKGQACVFKCHDPSFPSAKLPDCFFPSQDIGNGEPDQSLPYPKDCF